MSSPSPELTHHPFAGGQFFTPPGWADRLIDGEPLQRWSEGAHVLDPTGGDGALLEAFIRRALRATPASGPHSHSSDEAGPRTLRGEALSRLHMIEADPALIGRFRTRIAERYGVELPPECTRCADVLFDPPKRRYQVIVGNPPWMNFTELPADYREALKEEFLRYGLAPDRRRLLWGGARVDIAALVIARVMREFASGAGGRDAGTRDADDKRASDNPLAAGEQSAAGGRDAPAVARWFLPLSLFFGDAAHAGFRKLTATRFSVEALADLSHERVFKGVATDYGVAQMRAGESTVFPIASADACPDSGLFSGCTTRLHAGEQVEQPWRWETAGETEGAGAVEAATSAGVDVKAGTGAGADSNAGARIKAGVDARGERERERIVISPHSRPRQGVNTCGANELFMFRHDCRPPLEQALLYPLICATDFAAGAGSAGAESRGADREDAVHETHTPERLVFLPYDRESGKPLEEPVLKRDYPLSWEYLNAHRERLSARRGAVLRGVISRGYFWSLLGVGPYTFRRWKIVWRAYGKRDFQPRVFAGRWVPNQALQVAMAFETREEMVRVYRQLCDGRVARELRRSPSAGTPGFAQPGRVRHLFIEREEPNG